MSMIGWLMIACLMFCWLVADDQPVYEWLLVVDNQPVHGWLVADILIISLSLVGWLVADDTM